MTPGEGYDARARREAHAIAQNRMTERKRLECREGMAADVARNVSWAHIALREFQRGEYRPLRATDAELRRTCRQWRRKLARNLATAGRIAAQPLFTALVRSSGQIGIDEFFDAGG